MPSHRKRVRDANASAVRKQKTISDFFKPTTLTSSSPSTSTRTTTSPSSRRFDTPSLKARSTGRVKVAADERRRRVARALADSDVQMSRPPHRETMLMELDDDYNAEQPEDHVVLTQEELEVHAQLEALECSRDAPEDEKKSLPSSRRPRSERDADSNATLPKRKRIPISPPSPTRGTDCAAGARSEEQTPPRLPDASSSSSDSDDSVALIREHQTQNLRRSTRSTRSIDRFDPTVSAGVVNFNSVLDTGNRAATRSAKNALEIMMKERKLRDEQDEQLQTMRDDLEVGTTKVGEQEKEFASIADAEDRREKKRVANMQKYSAPVPLFTGPLSITELPKKYWVRGKGCVHHLHDLLLATKKGSAESYIAISMLPLCISTMLRSNVADVPFSVTTMLYHLVMFDDTLLSVDSSGRDDLVECLASIMERVTYRKRGQRLPSFVDTLQSYGASFDDITRPQRQKPQNIANDSLDSIAESAEKSPDAGNKQNSDADRLEKAARNLRRLCMFTAKRIHDGVNLREVFSSSCPHSNGQEAILQSVGICVRILCSPFGVRISRSVGPIIVQLLNRINTSRWQEFRVTVAKHVFSLTDRLGLHVELATFLFPQTSIRSRFVALDIAYLSLLQWSAGPGESPVPKDIQSYTRSESANTNGSNTVSYCLSDVIELLKYMPEPAKETDVEWACHISKVLKQCVADLDVLHVREEGQIGKLYQLIQRMRSSCHRMVFDAPVQDMRLALDALLASIRESTGISKAVLKEINPQIKFEKKQTSLSGLVTK